MGPDKSKFASGEYKIFLDAKQLIPVPPIEFLPIISCDEIDERIHALRAENQSLMLELCQAKMQNMLHSFTTRPQIKNVIFNDPATIVFWRDGTKTIVKCQPGDTFSKELGLAMAICKKVYGNKGNYNDVFKKWVPQHE